MNVLQIKRGNLVDIPTGADRLKSGEMYFAEDVDMIIVGKEDQTTTQFIGEAVSPVKKYVALLTQSGTNPPVAIVLENTLGGTLVWTYTTTGQYRGTLTGAFANNKTFCIMGNAVGFNGTTVYRAAGFRGNDDSVVILTHSGGAFVDGVLGPAGYVNGEFEIRVYE